MSFTKKFGSIRFLREHVGGLFFLKSRRTFILLQKRPKMELDIKAQIKANVKPKFEADLKIKIEPVEEFNRGMEIIRNTLNIPVKVEIKNKAIDVPLKRPKTEKLTI